MADPLFNKVAFIGIGLIGSSMAWRMAKDGLATEFVACARSEETRTKATALGLVSAAVAQSGRSRGWRGPGGNRNPNRQLQRDRRSYRPGLEAGRHYHGCGVR